MGQKRPSRRGDSDNNPRKRIRIVHEAATFEDVHTSRQLRQLLAFDQDLKKARHGLHSFKLLLDAVLTDHPEKQEGREEKRKIVLDYLESAKPGDAEGEETPVYLQDVIETWSLGGQVGNDQILSAVPVVLDLVLKLLSQTLELVPLGLGICRTLLQKRPLELISRNLSVEKSKEFIISPTLRMLREALCLDGGAIAKPIFRARLSTFKSLARNMGIRYIGEGTEELSRPSARTNAVRFFLSALKFLHAEARKDLLLQRDIVGALTRNIREDPPSLILEIFDSLRQYIILDEKITRDAKAKLLNAATLSNLAALYGYSRAKTEDSVVENVHNSVHDFLMLVCTTPSAGVLRRDTGFYPKETDQEEAAVLDADMLDNLGLDNIVWMNKFRDEVPVRNVTLAEFIQMLRPWSNVKQSELMIAIFEAVPELVANYFASKKPYSFEPKLSATWIGYAAFLFNVATLPLPCYFGQTSGYARLPPPPTLVFANILPAPLTQKKALSRCLTSKSNLTAFFATRILIVAVEKLREAVALHQDASHANSAIWSEAGRKLVDEFCQGSPSIQDIINAFRSIPEDDILHGEAASRLLRLYYEVVPQLTLTAKFDVSPFLDATLSKLADREGGDPKDHALGLLRLENLLAIARYSPGMRWFAKSELLRISPFTALLRVCVDAPRGVSVEGLVSLLSMVAKEEQLIAPEPKHPGLFPLLESLRCLREDAPDQLRDLWAFLDDCLSRFVAAPIKYIEALAELSSQVKQSAKPKKSALSVSPFSIVLLKQLKFASDTNLGALAQFLPTYMGLCKRAGEEKHLLKLVFSEMSKSVSGDEKPAKSIARMKLPESVDFKYYPLPKKDPSEVKNVDLNGLKEDEEEEENEEGEKNAMDQATLEATLAVSDSLVPDNSTLSKWSNKTVDELMDDGYAAALLSLLVSEHTSIRKEAVINILKMAAKIKSSEYEEKEQVWLLLCELVETVKPVVDAGPPPSPTVAFARHALDVLKNPLHPMYEKINIFLTRGPVWSLERLPLVHEILLEEPSVDDTYYATLNWLLTYLVDSLRTPADLALFHKKRMLGPIFERMLALSGNPYMRTPLRMQILRVVYRATAIEGGSTTLTTRFGISAWLEAQQATYPEEEDRKIYKALAGRLWRTCDQDRVSRWSRGGIEELSV